MELNNANSGIDAKVDVLDILCKGLLNFFVNNDSRTYFALR
jgi:hypothetical protein